MGIRSRGQVGDIFIAERRQSVQKAWPHGVSIASQRTSRQIGQQWRESIGAVGVHWRIPQAWATRLCSVLVMRSHQATAPSGVVIVGGNLGNILC
jgi:hypothetical protein